MNEYPKFKKVCKELIHAINENDEEEIKRLKINALYTATSYFDIILNYLTLERFGIHFDFGNYTIPKGTILYRIRKLNNEFDLRDSKEWGPSPMKRENRANRNGEEAIYLNVMPDICILETHLKNGEKYALGKYEVLDDVIVGGFFDIKESNRLLCAGILLNAVLIAPRRGDNNEELLKYLDQKFGNINADDISKEDILSEKNFYLPFKIASIVKKNNTYYGLTNDICDILKRYYPDGVRYSSCYAPTETIGIVSNCYNVVLYKSGIKKIRFVEAFECINNFKNENAEFNSVNIAKLILEMKTNE